MRSRHRRHRPTATDTNSTESRDPVTLEHPGTVRGLVIVLAITVIWNGGIAIFAINGPGGIFECFLIPFYLVGIGLIGSFFYVLFASFNPRVKVHLDCHPLVPGEEVVLEYEISGAAHRLRSFEIRALAKEIAVRIDPHPRPNTSGRMHTESRIFYDETIHRNEEPRPSKREMIRFTLPDHVIPTFDGSYCKIAWALYVHGDIRWWPDMRDLFEIRVNELVVEGGGTE